MGREAGGDVADMRPLMFRRRCFDDRVQARGDGVEQPVRLTAADAGEHLERIAVSFGITDDPALVPQGAGVFGDVDAAGLHVDSRERLGEARREPAVPARKRARSGVEDLGGASVVLDVLPPSPAVVAEEVLSSAEQVDLDLDRRLDATWASGCRAPASRRPRQSGRSPRRCRRLTAAQHPPRGRR